MPKSTEYRLNIRIDPERVQTIRTVASLGPRDLSAWVIEAIDEKLARIQQAELDAITDEYRSRIDAAKRFLAHAPTHPA